MPVPGSPCLFLFPSHPFDTHPPPWMAETDNDREYPPVMEGGHHLEAKHAASISPLLFRHAMEFPFRHGDGSNPFPPTSESIPLQESSELELLHTHNRCNLPNGNPTQYPPKWGEV